MSFKWNGLPAPGLNRSPAAIVERLRKALLQYEPEDVYDDESEIEEDLDALEAAFKNQARDIMSSLKIFASEHLPEGEIRVVRNGEVVGKFVNLKSGNKFE